MNSVVLPLKYPNAEQETLPEIRILLVQVIRNLGEPVNDPSIEDITEAGPSVLLNLACGLIGQARERQSWAMAALLHLCIARLHESGSGPQCTALALEHYRLYADMYDKALASDAGPIARQSQADIKTMKSMNSEQESRVKKLESQVDDSRQELHRYCGQHSETLAELLRMSRSDPSAGRTIHQSIVELRDNLQQHKSFLTVREYIENHAPGYALRLHQHCPELTETQFVVGALIKTGMDSREISGLMGINQRTVEAHRLKLRKKLGLHPHETLRQYLDAL